MYFQIPWREGLLLASSATKTLLCCCYIFILKMGDIRSIELNDKVKSGRYYVLQVLLHNTCRVYLCQHSSHTSLCASVSNLSNNFAEGRNSVEQPKKSWQFMEPESSLIYSKHPLLLLTHCRINLYKTYKQNPLRPLFNTNNINLSALWEIRAEPHSD